MKDISISILIPMYNAEKTIGRCLESICAQQPSNFEVIIVDDGSSDSSFETTQGFAKDSPFIHIYRQENSGVAKTRQKLIELATSDYIMFCDADDYFEPDAIQTVVACIGKYTYPDDLPDVFIFGYKLVRAFGNKTVQHRNLVDGVYTKQQIAKHHIKGMSDLYWSALWNKCYKRKLLSQPEIKFEKQMEDVMFNLDYMSRCNEICISSACIYNYVQIGESLTRSSKKDDVNSIIGAEVTYNRLIEKALAAYPQEELQIMKYAYTLNKQLENRATNIGESAFVFGGGARYKDYLGFRAILLDCGIFFDKQKSKLKSRIKALLSKR